MDINALILEAKLGSARKDAQVETCTVFAAALYDVLSAQDISCQVFTAVNPGIWAHAVVKSGGRYYDSKGEFSTSIYRARAKIHPTVDLVIEFKLDKRKWCEIDEYELLYEFYVKQLNKSWKSLKSKEVDATSIC